MDRPRPLPPVDAFEARKKRRPTRSAHACLKCLRPNHGELKANPLKPGVTTAVESGTCGDGAHINYAAPAPMLAATLVVQAALEWAAAPDSEIIRLRPWYMPAKEPLSQFIVSEADMNRYNDAVCTFWNRVAEAALTEGEGSD